MSWLTVRLTVAAADAAAAEALLELAGAASVSLDDAADSPLFEPRPGETPLWPRVRVQALLPSGTDTAALARVLGARFGAHADVAVRPLADDEWQAAGAEPIAPRRIGERLVLVGADDEPPRDGRRVVRLHMGLAFGTGAHPTTRLCLEWLERALAPDARVLDYGCGSGVLAIAALALGAREAYAVDDDPQALEAARENARLNGVAERLWIGRPEELAPITADVVVANILAGTLAALAPRLAARLRPGGTIVLSGVLEAQCASLQDAYAPWFDAFERATLDGWSRLVARRVGPERSR
ncbi:MAG TPA: 50S ribosomal protein L11 methyltransferase [Gammaproteobacteria bacterium]